MSEIQTQMQINPAEKTWRKYPRITAQLCISKAVYRRLRQRARAEGLTFSTWLKRAAMKELRRKSAL